MEEQKVDEEGKNSPDTTDDVDISQKIEDCNENNHQKEQSTPVERSTNEITIENKIVSEAVENKELTNTAELKEDVQHVEIVIESNDNNLFPSATEATSKNPAAQIFVNKPLCADYRSASESDSDSDSTTDSDSDSDSESDSDSSTCDSDGESSSSDTNQQNGNEKKTDSKKKGKKIYDIDLIDLQPIENLKISVPEDKCKEIGVISSIVDTFVVVQAHKDTPALDLDSVLFLDKGEKSLGKVYDVLGPVSEPVYTVRFSKVEDITEQNITPGLKVYYAPKTEHTSFVFVSELMKMRGSDASWKNNEEAPAECQDFSDDEEEQKFKKGEKNSGSPQVAPPKENEIRKRRAERPRYSGYSPGNFRNPFVMGSPRNLRFNRPPRYQPPNVANPRFACSQPPRFGGGPFPIPFQHPYYNMTYQYPGPMYNVPKNPTFGAPPSMYPPQQGPGGYMPGYPPPYPPHVFPPSNQMAPPGPPPMVQNQPNNANIPGQGPPPQYPGRVFGSGAETPARGS